MLSAETFFIVIGVLFLAIIVFITLLMTLEDHDSARIMGYIAIVAAGIGLSIVLILYVKMKCCDDDSTDVDATGLQETTDEIDSRIGTEPLPDDRIRTLDD